MTVLSSFLVLCSILVVPTAPLSNNRNIARVFGTTTSTSSGRPTTTSQHMALGGNYLDNIDNDENDRQNGGGQGNWGIFGPPSGNNNNRRGQDGTTNTNNRGGGGVGTAIRPPNNSNRGGAPSNYGIGGNRRQSGGNGVPRVVKIRQPQDLLDFVVEDERLSVGKFLNTSYVFLGVVYVLSSLHKLTPIYYFIRT